MADDKYPRGYRNDPPARGGTGAAGPAVDPLTELARLIGQSDPFAGIEQRRPTPRAPEQSAPPADWRSEPPRDDAYDDRGHAHEAHDDRRDYPPDEQPQAEPGYYDDGHDGGAYPDPSYDRDGIQAGHDDRYAADPHGEDPDDLSRFYDDDEMPAPRRRGWVLTAVALIGLAMVGAAGAFAYRAVFSGGMPSIIARDPGPNKIIPSSQNADSRTNKRVDRIATGASDERVVSREEQPIPLPDTARSTPPIAQGGAAPLTAPVQPSPPADVAAPAPGTPGGPAPRKIHTVTIKSDASPADAPVPVGPRATPPRATTAAQAPTQPTPLPITPQGAPPPPAAAGQGGPLSLSPQPQVATAAPPPRAATRAPASAEAGYYVQVTAQRSEEEAQTSFRDLQGKYASLLGSHQPVIRRKDLGAKGVFYGAQIGPFSHDEAVQLCQSLKSAGGPCMVQKN